MLVTNSSTWLCAALCCHTCNHGCNVLLRFTVNMVGRCPITTLWSWMQSHGVTMALWWWQLMLSFCFLISTRQFIFFSIVFGQPIDFSMPPWTPISYADALNTIVSSSYKKTWHFFFFFRMNYLEGNPGQDPRCDGLIRYFYLLHYLYLS